jgi:hypothetical protein
MVEMNKSGKICTSKLMKCELMVSEGLTITVKKILGSNLTSAN